MEAEQSTLKDQNNKETWEEIISKYKSTLKEYKKKIQNLEENLEEEQGNENYLDPDAKVDLNQLNVQQAKDRGNAIIKKDGSDDEICEKKKEDNWTCSRNSLYDCICINNMLFS